MKKILCVCAGVALAAAACGKKEATETARESASDSYAETLMAALIDAKPGDVIEMPEGKFSFDRSLSLVVDGVTLRGAGLDKTILSFKDQIAGAEGILVNASDFTAEDFAIEDTKGDGLKVSEGENIVLRRLRVEWTGGPETENGAYGLYPVQTKNVLVESNVVIGASDAGLYVGQSENVIVRNNRAERNVAGIEIENTTGADVYDNVAAGNTGGVLVFNMPNLSPPGAKTRVFRNEVVDNNTRNFGAPGTAVAGIPAGSGIVVNSNDEVEIFDNDISGHRTANIIISSVFSTNLSKDGVAADFDPYPDAIYIYDNRLSDGGGNPDDLALQALRIARFGPTGTLPDVLWDGYADPKKNGPVVCLNNEGAEIMNLDGPNNNKSPRIATAEHACDLPKLPAVSLANGLGG